MKDRIADLLVEASELPAARAVYGFFQRRRRLLWAFPVVVVLTILLDVSEVVFGRWTWLRVFDGFAVGGALVLLFVSVGWARRGLPRLAPSQREVNAAVEAARPQIEEELQRVFVGMPASPLLLQEVEMVVRDVAGRALGLTPAQVEPVGLRLEDGSAREERGASVLADGFRLDPVCPVWIPGIGECEVLGRHDQDGRLNLVHRHGAVSWNGDGNFSVGAPSAS